MPRSCLQDHDHTLPTVSHVRALDHTRHTKLDGIVPGQQGEHSDDGCQPWTFPICYDAHGYTRGIHAQVRSGALVDVRWHLLWRQRQAYDDIALGGRELELIGELRCPCRVGILAWMSLDKMLNGRLTYIGTTCKRDGCGSDDRDDASLLVGGGFLLGDHVGLWSAILLQLHKHLMTRGHDSLSQRGLRGGGKLLMQGSRRRSPRVRVKDSLQSEGEVRKHGNSNGTRRGW